MTFREVLSARFLSSQQEVHPVSKVGVWGSDLTGLVGLPRYLGCAVACQTELWLTLVQAPYPKPLQLRVLHKTAIDSEAKGAFLPLEIHRCMNPENRMVATCSSPSISFSLPKLVSKDIALLIIGSNRSQVITHTHTRYILQGPVPLNHDLIVPSCLGRRRISRKLECAGVKHVLRDFNCRVGNA